MKVAAFQFAPAPADVERNVATVERALRDAARQGAQIVGLPELWPTSFAFGALSPALDATERALARLCALSRELGVVIVGSALGRSGGARPLNLGHVIDRGEIVARYAKVHLFTPTHEDDAFEAGSARPPIVDTSAGRVSIVICYDLRFPELCRDALLEKADVVIVPAQWAAERFEQWRALVVGRAVENQCVVVGVNRTGSEATPLGTAIGFPGRSLIADAFGVVEAEGSDSEQIVLADVDVARQAALRRLIPCARDRRPDVYGGGARDQAFRT